MNKSIINATSFPIIEISRLAEKESWRKEINRPIYHLHKWWAQRLGSVFRAILLHEQNSSKIHTWDLFYENNDFDKTIFDPFMGSGTTLGEALKLGNRVVGCDINPISAFLVRQELSSVSIDALYEHMRIIKAKVSDKIMQFYLTKDPVSGISIQALYYFWVKMVCTPSGEKIPLFSKYVFAQDASPSKKPMAKIICPKCWNIFSDNYNTISTICPSCNTKFNPQNGPAEGVYITDLHNVKYKIKSLLSNNQRLEEKLYAIVALRNNGEKIFLKPTMDDLLLYQKAENELLSSLNLPIPEMEVRSGYNTDQARGYNYLFWRDFFNPRQLYCLGILLQEILNIQNEIIREQFLCLFSSTLEYNNMFCSYKGEGTGAVRPIFSNHILKPERTSLENTVWGTDKSSGCFSTLFKTRFLKAKEYLNNPFELKICDLQQKCVKVLSNRKLRPKIVDSWSQLSSNRHSALILCGDSARTPLPDKCIDLIVTDPPFFDYVHYSELSDFFYAWLAPVLKQKYPEFVDPSSGRKNEVQQTNPDEFSKLLGFVFSECARVMKDEAKLCFSFHHARSDGWLSIAKALIASNMYIKEVFPVHAELMAAKPKSAAKEPISLDTILICTKHQQKSVQHSLLSNYYIKLFKDNCKKLSNSDIFVIKAGQFIVCAVNERLPYSEISSNLQNLAFPS
jgi:putative DNA methylase